MSLVLTRLSSPRVIIAPDKERGYCRRSLQLDDVHPTTFYSLDIGANFVRVRYSA